MFQVLGLNDLKHETQENDLSSNKVDQFLWRSATCRSMEILLQTVFILIN